MAYVDGFIVAVPRKNLATYRKMSTKCATVWREHGAMEYREWIADDVTVGAPHHSPPIRGKGQRSLSRWRRPRPGNTRIYPAAKESPFPPS